MTLEPSPSSATRGATGERVPLVSSREWALGSKGVRATAAWRHRKEKEPSMGTGSGLPFESGPFGLGRAPGTPLLALPAAVQQTRLAES